MNLKCCTPSHDVFQSTDLPILSVLYNQTQDGLYEDIPDAVLNNGIPADLHDKKRYCLHFILNELQN